MPQAELAAISEVGERLETGDPDAPLVWRRWGGKGRPLVLIHGGSGSWTHWIRSVLPLSAHYQVYAVDLPGCGDSALPDPGLSIEGIAKSVSLGLSELLAPDQHFLLAGFSFGSAVGARMAATNAGCAGLVLVGSTFLGKPLTVDLLSPKGAAGEELERIQRHNLKALMFSSNDAIDPLSLLLYDRNVASARFRNRHLSVADTISAALPRIREPIVAISGADDLVMLGETQGQQDALAALAPRASFHLIPGAGHWVMYEAAAGFNDILLKSIGAMTR
jgi:2-hydroxy-6-oxonona-2,4-dienedioate hydrolase